MIRRIFFLLLATLALAGCGARKQTKVYDMQGEIKASTRRQTATVQHGKIGDWMEPMTMEYSVKPDSEFQKLHVGDHIQAKVVVEDPHYYITSVQILGLVMPDPKCPSPHFATDRNGSIRWAGCHPAGGCQPPRAPIGNRRAAWQAAHKGLKSKTYYPESAFIRVHPRPRSCFRAATC